MSIEQQTKIADLQRQIDALQERLDALEGEKLAVEGEIIREQITRERIDLQTRPERTPGRQRGTLTLGEKRN